MKEIIEIIRRVSEKKMMKKDEACRDLAHMLRIKKEAIQKYSVKQIRKDLPAEVKRISDACKAGDNMFLELLKEHGIRNAEKALKEASRAEREESDILLDACRTACNEESAFQTHELRDAIKAWLEVSII